MMTTGLKTSTSLSSIFLREPRACSLAWLAAKAAWQSSSWPRSRSISRCLSPRSLIRLSLCCRSCLLRCALPASPCSRPSHHMSQRYGSLTRRFGSSIIQLCADYQWAS